MEDMGRAGVGMVMRVEHAGVPLTTPWRRRQTNRQTEVELPVGVGHGIVHLFLLEELSDGQQFFQYMLHRETEQNQSINKNAMKPHNTTIFNN